MSKEIDVVKEFEKELKENDKKVKNELKHKTREELNSEFVNFVKTNKCKIKGGKNGRK